MPEPLACSKPIKHCWIGVERGLVHTLTSSALCSNDSAALQALCAYANCTIVEGTNPPVAECCQVSTTTLQRDAYSVGTATTILDKNLQSITENVS
jgi:hypothetical protein